MSLLPTFSFSSLDIATVANNPTLTLEVIDFLRKDLYSYPTIESMQDISISDRSALLQYYSFLNSTYFEHSSIHETVSPDIESLIFNEKHWNLMAKTIIDFQNYLLKTVFEDFSLTLNQNNYTVRAVQMQINEHLDLMREVYETNKANPSGKVAFQPIKITQLSQDLQTQVNEFISDKALELSRVAIQKSSEPSNKTDHWVKLI